MKKSIGIFVLLLSTVVFMSSCKKDMSKLPGTWKAISATIDNDSEDDLDDMWTFRTDGTCTIECDFDEYFDNTFYNIVTFEGTYTTKGNETITITSNKLHQIGDEYYEKVIYDLDILLLNKNTMMVSGTVKLVSYEIEGNLTDTKKADVSITLSKR